jgi:initiation factor 1A
MPKNLKGGNRAKKGKNSALRQEKKLEYATEGQWYGVCTNYYGSHRGQISYFGKIPDESGKLVDQEVSALGIIRGSIRKRTRLRNGDLVIVAPRDFQIDKVDIVYKYSFDEVNKLKKEVTLHPNLLQNIDKSSSQGEDNAEAYFNFGNDDDSDNSDEDTTVKIKNEKQRFEKGSYQSIYSGMPSFSDDELNEKDEIDDI